MCRFERGGYNYTQSASVSLGPVLSQLISKSHGSNWQQLAAVSFVDDWLKFESEKKDGGEVSGGEVCWEIPCVGFTGNYL